MTYKLHYIILLESYFKRAPFIHFESKNIKNDIDIKHRHEIQENLLNVIVSIDFSTHIDNEEVIKAYIEMAGLFEFSNEGNENPLPIEDFAKINAPAIIFPFVREHLANLSMKAGIQPVVIPPVNFIELAKQERNNKDAHSN